MAPALQTEQLTKRFGNAPPAVNALSLTVPRGAVYGFLGANGAGKTTTLRLVLGLLRPTAGTIRLFGRGASPRGEVGALIETPSPYPNLTGRENLDITRRLLGRGRTEIDRVLDIVDLRAAADRRVGGYSLGMRQRLGIARALLGKPRLLILDEPTNGLDPDGISEMRTLIRRLPENGDVTLVVSSHLLSEVEQVASHVGLLHQGRLLLEAPLRSILDAPGPVEVGTSDGARSATLLAAAGFQVSAAEDAGLLLVAREDRQEADPSEIAALLVRDGQRVSHLARRRRSLEHVYHDHVRQAA